jgi:hypothetical protein
VPIVVGQGADQACATLVAAQLVCARQDAGVAARQDQVGVVQAQQPAAGAVVPPGTSVTVVYPTQPPPPPTTTVPSVVGTDPGTACATLQAAALVCDQDGTEDTLQPGVVHAQSVAPGSVVAPGTHVQIVYNGLGSPGAALTRYKAPGAARANFLTVGDYPAPAGWSYQGQIATVYTAGQAGRLRNLVPVYRYCHNSCGAPDTFYYSANPATPAGYVQQGVAFSCFTSQPAGTRPLQALFNGTVWVWAVAGSTEYGIFTGAGFQDKFTVCFVG